MTISIDKVEQYAKLLKTKVIAHRIHPNHVAVTFVLESGPKLTMTKDELDKAIDKLTPKDEAEPKPKPVKEQKPKPVKE